MNAETRHHIWANRYDVPLSDLFRTQDEIMRQIIGHLVPRIEVESLHLARRQPTELLQAYDYYLRGKAALYAATDAKGTAEAKDYFERAITVDPDFAYPYAYLTRIYNNLQPCTPRRARPLRHFARRRGSSHCGLYRLTTQTPTAMSE